jgi:mannose-6-phosphate isomerase-like protein (cupin superfamily)
MLKAVNVEKCFGKFKDTFSPKIVAKLNGQHVKLVRAEGDKVPWHTHDHEDELFFVIDGALDVLQKDGQVRLNPGEFCVVEKGTEHKIVPIGHARLLLFEPAGIAHTGRVRSEITKDSYDYLET